jgi:glycosyltransferase involved in cell wall biosynthesis
VDSQDEFRFYVGDGEEVEMPRVLRIINRLNLGGPTFNASYLSRYMPDDYETMLVAGMKDEHEASSDFIPLSMGLEPVYIRSMRREIDPFKDRRAYQEIRKIIDKFKPDIVHTHAAKAGALGRLAAHHAGVPVITHTFHGHVFHSYFNPVKTNVFLKIERYLASKSSRIIAISKRQKEEIGEEFKVVEPEKISVIPLGFDLSRFQEDVEAKRNAFRKEWKLSEETVAIGIIGRLVPVKNHPMFLKAIQALKNQTSIPFQALLIGDGEDRSALEAMAREMGLLDGAKPAVKFTSWIKDIDRANAGLDIITLTSFNEGTPVSLIEAQAANKPVISTKVGGVEDIVLEGVTGLLCQVDDVEELTTHLKTLVENADLRRQMSENGYKHVSDKFGYQRLVNDVHSLYEELLNKAR